MKIRYRTDEAAARHGAEVERETESPGEAYAAHPTARAGPYREGLAG